jgi:hypothetical protein
MNNGMLYCNTKNIPPGYRGWTDEDRKDGHDHID